MNKGAQRDRVSSVNDPADLLSRTLLTTAPHRCFLKSSSVKCYAGKENAASDPASTLILMLVDSEVLPKSKNDKIVLGQVAKAVSGVVRETDLTGWFEEGSIIGVILTELGSAEVSSAPKSSNRRSRRAFKTPLDRANSATSAFLFTPSLRTPRHGAPGPRDSQTVSRPS